MATIKVTDFYKIQLQKQDVKSFTNNEGRVVNLPAENEREAWVVVGEYDEFTVPFILPEHFEVTKDNIKIGVTLSVTCNGLDDLRPLKIKNVNRVIPAVK